MAEPKRDELPEFSDAEMERWKALGKVNRDAVNLSMQDRPFSLSWLADVGQYLALMLVRDGWTPPAAIAEMLNR